MEHVHHGSTAPTQGVRAAVYGTGAGQGSDGRNITAYTLWLQDDAPMRVNMICKANRIEHHTAKAHAPNTRVINTDGQTGRGFRAISRQQNQNLIKPSQQSAALMLLR